MNTPKGRIFISYRRVDSEGYAGRIYDRLAPHFGDDAIFMDVDDIPAGVDFVKFLENEVLSCDVLIALIGRQWLNVKDEHGKRRLNNPTDFVRIEIATALKRGIRVIPILLGGSQMPQDSELPDNLQALTRRNGLPVYHHSFHTDTNRLINHLEDALAAAERSRKEQQEKERKEKEEREKKIAEERAQKEKEEKERNAAVERARQAAEKKARKEQGERDKRILHAKIIRLQSEAQELIRNKKYKQAQDRLISIEAIYVSNPAVDPTGEKHEEVKLQRENISKTIKQDNLEKKRKREKTWKEFLAQLQANVKQGIIVVTMVLVFIVFYLSWPTITSFFSNVMPLANTLTPTPTNTILVKTPTEIITPVIPTNTSVPKTFTPNLPTSIPEITATPTELLREITDDKGIQMVLVPEGAFTMGSNGMVTGNVLPLIGGREWKTSETGHIPAHTVYLDSYYIDMYEVTNKMYQECEKEGICDPPAQSSSYSRPSYYENPEFEEYPVIYVNYYMASTFCEWRGARLPTEAEWEKAIRGTDDDLYIWGNLTPNCTLANIGRERPCDGDTSKVGSYFMSISPYGAHDMTGNVQEWVSDWYDEKYYEISPSENPQGPEHPTTGKTVRGGSWVVHDPLEYAYRVYLRSLNFFPSETNMDTGFRCAVSASE